MKEQLRDSEVPRENDMKRNSIQELKDICEEFAQVFTSSFPVIMTLGYFDKIYVSMLIYFYFYI